MLLNLCRFEAEKVLHQQSFRALVNTAKEETEKERLRRNINTVGEYLEKKNLSEDVKEYLRSRQGIEFENTLDSDKEEQLISEDD